MRIRSKRFRDMGLVERILSNRPLILLLGICVSMTGCGGEQAGRTAGGEVSGSAISGSAVSGNAVSGSVVSKGAVSEHTEKTDSDTDKHRFCTDTNFYMTAYDSKKDEFDDDVYTAAGFECVKKEDVSQRKRINIKKFENILTVTEDSVFYIKKDKTVWRMPIEKDTEGYDTLKENKAEKLFEEREGIIIDSGCFVYGSCITYVTYGGKEYEGKAVRYNWENGKESRHQLEGNNARLIPADEKHLIVANLYGGYSLWNVKNDTWTRFSDDEEAINEPMAVSGDSFFYVEADKNTYEETVFRYDWKKKNSKPEVFLTEKQLEKAGESYVTQQGGEFRYISMCQLFCYNDTLYVQMQVDWIKENKYRMNYVVFCVDVAHGNELVPAKDWMDFIEKNSADETIAEKVDGCESVVYNAARGMYLVDGKLILILTGEGDVRIECYDLEKKTGKVVEEKKDAEYFLPYYDNCDEDPEYGYGVYPDWEMEGGMSFVPEELEDYWGC